MALLVFVPLFLGVGQSGTKVGHEKKSSCPTILDLITRVDTLKTHLIPDVGFQGCPISDFLKKPFKSPQKSKKTYENN